MESLRIERNMCRFMKQNTIWILAIVFSITACRSNKTFNANPKFPLPPVTIGTPVKGNKTVYTEFRAVSRYLQSINYRARTAGIITRVFTRPGDDVKLHQPLFIIKPAELSALESSGSLSHSIINSGDTIFSDQKSLTNHVLVQDGDYVQPGNLLATAFKENSLVAVTYVPFSQVPLIKINSPCTVEVPGKGNVKSFFKKQLFLADNITQTQPFIVPLPGSLRLSGNMNLSVHFKEKEIHNGIFVPREAVLTNEEENIFWLMKMANDTTAVRVPVTIGWQGKNSIQVLSGNINTSDKIITGGAYGLPDTAYVRIVK